MLNLNTKNRLQIVDKSKFYNRPYTFFKPDYSPIIPLDIYQTWSTKDLPPKMSERVEILKRQNPRFRHHLYDDNDCREFIRTHFKPDVLWAYDSLIPGAYKADLWRYCILFIYGGIYLDIKYKPLNGFRFINLTEKEHLVADINNVNIYNALMVCLPGNQILFKALRQIVENVKTKYYGNGWLDPTGPALLSKFVSMSEEIVDLKHELINDDNNFKVIYFNNIPILKSYNGHIRERDKYSKKKHYATLWNERRIYL